jgi:hypothetical protein
MFLPLTEVSPTEQVKVPGIKRRLFCGVRERASSAGDLPIGPDIHRFLSEEVDLHKVGPSVNITLD